MVKICSQIQLNRDVLCNMLNVTQDYYYFELRICFLAIESHKNAYYYRLATEVRAQAKQSCGSKDEEMCGRNTNSLTRNDSTSAIGRIDIYFILASFKLENKKTN